MSRKILLVAALCLAAGAPSAHADYLGRWDRLGGGWTTNWIRHSGDANVCGHYAAGCRCGNANYCGTYRNGAETVWWAQGCNRPAWRIRCTIRPIADTGAADCRNYAGTAVRQNAENVQRRCGYTGGRWQSNYQAHYGWCLGASPAARAGETRARQDQLAQCTQAAGACRNYAGTAIQQNWENLRRRCGYTGARWHSNRQANYGWCLGASPAMRAGETQARHSALAQCGARIDALGSVWDEQEVAGWRGTWRRRGRSNVFDANWVHPNGSRERAVLTIHISGRTVTVNRQQIAPSHPGQRCTYHGTLSPDGRTVIGTYGCSWARGPFNWRATIR